MQDARRPIYADLSRVSSITSSISSSNSSMTALADSIRLTMAGERRHRCAMQIVSIILPRPALLRAPSESLPGACHWTSTLFLSLVLAVISRIFITMSSRRVKRKQRHR